VGSELEKLVSGNRGFAAAATLYTMGITGTRTPCCRWGAPVSALPDDAELLEQIEERALRQANVLGGVHNFQLELYDGDKNPIGCEFFRVSAESFGQDRSLLTEPANEGGVLAQQMRLTEAYARTHVTFTEKGFGQLTKVIDTMAKRVEQSETNSAQMMATLYEVLIGRGDAEVEVQKAKGNAQAKVVMAERVMGLLPAIAAGFMLKNTGPTGAAHFAAQGADAFYSSITEEQLRVIMTALNPDQRQQLFIMIEGIAKEKAAAEAAERAAKSSNGSNGANGSGHAKA